MTTTAEPSAPLQPTDTIDTTERKYPPVAQLVMASLTLVIIGGIVISSYAPRRPPLGVPTALLVASVVLYAAAVVLLARIPDFAWRTFRVVAGWALLAYVISAGMIELAFVHNDTSGAPLVVLTLLLVMFAVTVPTIIAFTVARYADE